eukprot:2608928-Prorocentrum_lima.AAC.1
MAWRTHARTWCGQSRLSGALCGGLSTSNFAENLRVPIDLPPFCSETCIFAALASASYPTKDRHSAKPK